LAAGVKDDLKEHSQTLSLTLAVWAVGLLASAALAFWWRRIAGALERPLSWPMLLAAGALIAATAAAARVAWGHWITGLARGPATRRLDVLVLLLVLAVAGALSVPGSPPAGLVLCWGLLAAEELWAWTPRRKWLQNWMPGLPGTLGGQPVQQGPAGPRAIPAGDVIQQITRHRAGDGTEMLSGWVRVPLSAGQRNTSVHLSFCPPLDRTPQLAVHQREGPPAKVKAAQVLPYGVRLDLKLAEAAESAGYVLLEFTAHC
jgi:hypothetical protein